MCKFKKTISFTPYCDCWRGMDWLWEPEGQQVVTDPCWSRAFITRTERLWQNPCCVSGLIISLLCITSFWSLESPIVHDAIVSCLQKTNLNLFLIEEDWIGPEDVAAAFVTQHIASSIKNLWKVPLNHRCWSLSSTHCGHLNWYYLTITSLYQWGTHLQRSTSAILKG